MGFFEKLKEGLSKTKNSMMQKVDDLFKAFVKVDEDLLEELEELLIEADVGVNTSVEVVDELRETIKSERISDSEEAKAALRKILLMAFC